MREPTRADVRSGRAASVKSLVIAVLAAGSLAAAAVGALRAYYEAHSSREVVAELVPARAIDTAAVPPLPTTDITKAAGIDFVHVSGAAGEKLLPETMGGGCALFDYDNDGDADLLLVNCCHWPGKRPAGQAEATMALLANDGRGRFTDVTRETGLAISCYGMGPAIGDFDGDGWSDVFVATLGPDLLLKNERGKFVDVTREAGVAGADDSFGSCSCWLDFNRDGRLDLFVGNYVKWSREIDLSTPIFMNGTERAYEPPQYFQGALNHLYRNDGGGRFSDVSEAAGIHVFSPRPSEADVPLGKALGVVPFDFDEDGWQDLFVANDTVRNFLFRNRGDGTFEEIAERAGTAFDWAGGVLAGMGIDVACPRNDGAAAVAIGTYLDETTSFFVAQGGPGELTFTDETLRCGLGPQTRSELKWSILFLDFDLDGRQDLLTTNGHVESGFDRRNVKQKYRQPPRLFWNAGGGQSPEFIRVPEDKLGEDFSRPLAGRGAAYADLDADGDLDLVLTQIDGPPRLVRNDQALSHHWLRVKLRGKAPNPEALGAIVRLTAAGVTQERRVGPTHGYLSQSELPVTFGLGATGAVDRLQIVWPDGTQQEILGPQVDRLHEIRQASPADEI